MLRMSTGIVLTTASWTPSPKTSSAGRTGLLARLVKQLPPSGAKWCQQRTVQGCPLLCPIKHAKPPWNRIRRAFHSLWELILQLQGKQLDTSLREAILSSPSFLVCACVCYQVWWRFIYAFHRVPPEKKARPEFSQTLDDLEMTILHLNCQWRTEWQTTFLQGHISLQLLREGAELHPGFTGSFPRKGHTHGIGGKLQFQRVSALSN